MKKSNRMYISGFVFLALGAISYGHGNDPIGNTELLIANVWFVGAELVKE